MKKIIFFIMFVGFLQVSFIEASNYVDKNDPYYMGSDEDFKVDQAAQAARCKQQNKDYDQRQAQDAALYENFLKNKYDKSSNRYLIGYGLAHVDENGTITTFDEWRKDNSSYTEFMYGDWRQASKDDITPFLPLLKYSFAAK